MLNTLERIQNQLRKFFYPILTVSTISIILFTVGYSFFYDINLANESYDASNTYRIAQQPLNLRREILHNEQNFELYYDIIATVFRIFGNNYRYAVLLNLIVWLISIVLVKKFIDSKFSSKNWQLFYLFLYVSSAQLIYYAFYMRMYGLINLSTILHIFLIEKYIKNRDWRILFAGGINLIIMTNLHPVTIVFLGIVGISSMITIRSKPHLLLFTSLIAAGAITNILQIVNKVNWLDTYLGRGVNYLSGITMPFYTFPHFLLFKWGNYFSWILFCIILYTLWLIIKSRLLLKKEHMHYVIPAVFFIAMTFFLQQFSNARHFIFFAVPLLFTIYVGISLLKGRIKLIMAAVMYLYFSCAILSLFVVEIDKQNLVRSFCIEIHAYDFKNGIAISDMYLYQILRDCAKNVQIALPYRGKLVLDTQLGPFAILKEQSLLGGYTYQVLSRVGVPAKEEVKELLKKGIPNIADLDIQPEYVYLLDYVLPKQFVNLYELKMLEGYSFDRLDGNIIIFKKNAL